MTTSLDSPSASPAATLPRDEASQPEDLAELVESLGGIPLHRIRFRPYPGTATEADVITAMEAPRKRLCELIDGILVEKAMGYSESMLAMYLARLLDDYIRPLNLGLVTGPDGTIRLWTGRVRVPDVAYVSWDRMPGRKRPKAPIPELAPNLAVEVLSTSNTAAEMKLKLDDYFRTGVQLVWIIDPDARRVAVHTTPDVAVTLTEKDTLDGGSTLPGFSLPLQKLFAELDRQG